MYWLIFLPAAIYSSILQGENKKQQICMVWSVKNSLWKIIAFEDVFKFRIWYS